MTVRARASKSVERARLRMSGFSGRIGWPPGRIEIHGINFQFWARHIAGIVDAHHDSLDFAQLDQPVDADHRGIDAILPQHEGKAGAQSAHALPPPSLMKLGELRSQGGE